MFCCVSFGKIGPRGNAPSLLLGLEHSGFSLALVSQSEHGSDQWAVGWLDRVMKVLTGGSLGVSASILLH